MLDIREKLAAKNVPLADFQAINALLISKGFLSRRDGGRHTKLYDVAHRAEDEIRETLGVVYGAELLHDSRTKHYRLLPFGERGDGLPDPGEDMEIRRELKGSVVKDFVVALLTLRILYNEQIGQRQIEADGRVSVRVTEFVTTMKVNFKSELPAADFHRKAIFAKLRKLGVADLDIESVRDLRNDEVVISIRPEIETLVYDSVLARALRAIEEAAAEADAGPVPDDADGMDGAEEADVDGDDEVGDTAQ
ncbi:hypothetical protein GCM10008171_33810 [Methylopila jiangsuensis]|uniref:DUF4194 domain-containing protein n=1 Tax=Methylopila jiangsuensis TaxID=586230 RepID=A0A9W6JJE8_9HYPH|nr:DUF4194 domain-containing protein [Methylopila jiangsuensis]MDR6284485.1 hypothetical protein [Methylopila jiangsuensis]GLK78127.1 hypothetical protein GCM10008171_33810 [Methylopila jiangsuensis]